jgi:hypothetical protein
MLKSVKFKKFTINYSKKTAKFLEPIEPIKLNGLNKEILRENFSKVFDRYTSLFENFLNVDLDPLPTSENSTPLTRRSDRSYYIRGETLRHPLIFYFGHTASLYINKLMLFGLIKDSERVDKWMEERCSVGNFFI